MSRATPPRAVIFDFDGTLVDSLPLVLAAIAHAIAPFGKRPARDILASLGGPPERFLLALVDDAAHVPVALERMETYHRENAHLIRPYDGVREVLHRLGRAGIAVALWTGRDRASTEWLVREHGLGSYFATTVCGDDLPTHKPDPEGLREIMRRLGVAAPDALFVGDADVDVLGGAACGVDTLLIRHAREIELPIATRSWRTVATPSEAFALVLGCVAKIS